MLHNHSRDKAALASYDVTHLAEIMGASRSNHSFRNFRAVGRNIRRMLALAWRMDAKLTVSYYLTAFLGALGPIATAVTLKFLIDGLVQDNRGIGLGMPIVVVLGAHYGLLALTGAIRVGLNEHYFDYLFRYKLQSELTYQFNEKLSQLDVQHVEDPEVQKLVTKTRDTHAWRVPDFLRILSYALMAVVGFVSAAIALLPFGAWIVLAVVACILPRLLLRAKLGDVQWSMYGSGAPQIRSLWYYGWLLSEESSLREMKVFGTGPALLTKYRALQDKLFALNTQPLRQNLKLMLVGPLLEAVLVFTIAYVKLSEVEQGTMTVGSYALLIAMLQQLVTSAGSLGMSGGQVYENSLFVEHFFELMDIRPVLEEDPDPVSFEKIKPPAIEFKNVSFRYPNGTEVLQNVSFRVEPGRSVALVGVNGSGKSTIIKLICRFYDVTEGQILINGVDLRKLKLSNWYRHIGTLFQDFVHYKLTVRDNIVLGAPERSPNDADVVLAAQSGGAAPFIEQLPMKYDQLLGADMPGGIQLSGGQWQKLAIARAFFHASPVLIMDEPTSAIDAEAEYEIFNALEVEYRDRTLILVSHRFSTVRNAHQILVVDGGRIIEKGTHDALLAANGKYAAMFTAQAAGYR